MKFCVACFAFFVYIAISLAGRDFYDILQVSRNAETNEIKKSYRKLARELHPDINKDDPKAEERLVEINKAYTVLSDKKLRKKYDKYGEKGLDSDFADHADHSFSSFFGDFFGHDVHERRELRGADVNIDCIVTLEEVYVGNFVTVTRNKPVAKVAPGSRKCNCHQEMVTEQLGPGRFRMLQRDVCDECPNVRFEAEEHVLELEIEEGVRSGHQLRFVAEGEPHIEGEPGDLIVTIRTEPHPRFHRVGDDLYTNVTLSLRDALVGFEMNILHLDGHAVKITRDKVTWPGAKIKKKSEGMPNHEDNTKFGHMYVTFDVQFPNDVIFDEAQKASLVQLLGQPSAQAEYNGIHGFPTPPI